MGISSHIQSMPLSIIFLPHISQVINWRCWKSWESQTGWSVCSWLRDSVLWMTSLLRSRYGCYCLVTFPHVVPSTIKILPGKILQMKWIRRLIFVNYTLHWEANGNSRNPMALHGSTKACKGGLGRLSKFGHSLRMEIFWTLLDFKPSTDNICIVSTSHYQSLCLENQSRTSTSTRYDCGFWRQPLFESGNGEPGSE